MVFDEENYEIRIYVDSPIKAEALEQLLPKEKNFVDIVVSIIIIPGNENASSKIDLFKKAFEGNEALSFIETIDDVFTNPIHYVVFKNEVVQYFSDNLSDIHGVRSTLYQDIAREIFEDADGIYFCTDFPD